MMCTGEVQHFLVYHQQDWTKRIRLRSKAAAKCAYNLTIVTDQIFLRSLKSKKPLRIRMKKGKHTHLEVDGNPAGTIEKLPVKEGVARKGEKRLTAEAIGL